MSDKTKRWEQRFSNYCKALMRLEVAVNYIKEDLRKRKNEEDLDSVLDDLIKQGLIQSFEFTHELAWNVFKDYAIFQGNVEISGSRDATREAFSMGLITDGNIWMQMIRSRNETSHTYNQATADSIYDLIIHEYYGAFVNFRRKMEELRTGRQSNLFED